MRRRQPAHGMTFREAPGRGNKLGPARQGRGGAGYALARDLGRAGVGVLPVLT